MHPADPSVASFLPPDVASRAVRLLEFAAIADRVLPKGSPLFADAYPGPFLGAAPWLYEAHVRQLLRGDGDGEERALTTAEVVLALSEASLKAPFKQEYQRAFEVAFNECRRDASMEEVEMAGVDLWPGQSVDVLDELKRKMHRLRCRR